MNPEQPKDVFTQRANEILDDVYSAQCAALRHVAKEIASTNTTLRDLDEEIDEKIAYGHDLDELTFYLELLQKGSEQIIRAHMNQAVSQFYITLEEDN